MNDLEFLSFPNNYPFGVEIEVFNKNTSDIEDILKKENNIKIMDNYLNNFIFFNSKDSIWTFKNEDVNEFDKRLDIEIISPILYNKRNDLNNLKNILEILDNNNALVNENCGFHVHIGAKPFLCSYQNY